MRRSIALAAMTAAVLIAFAAPARASAPAPTAAAPGSAAQGAEDKLVRLTGTDFTPDSWVSFGSGVTINDVVYNSTAMLSVYLSVDESAATGARDVFVSDPETGDGTCEDCFTVTPGPSLDGVTPSSLAQGAQNQQVVLTGNNFDGVVSVVFGGYGIRVNSVTPAGSGKLSANVTVYSNAPTTSRDVSITATDGGRATCQGCFTVIPPAPAVQSTRPNARGQGAQNQKVAIYGRNFTASSTVEFSGEGITITDTAVISSGVIVATVAIAPTAEPGPRNVSVTAGGGTATCFATCFTVNAGPVARATQPLSAPQGASNRDVRLVGSGFVQGARVSFGPDVFVTRVVYGATSLITANVTILSSAATGARDVKVVNPDAGVSLCTGCFTITAAPSALSLSPDELPQGTQNTTIEIAGANLGTGSPRVLFSGSGITVNGVAASTDGTVEVNISVSSGAIVGARNVAVLPADGGRTTCVACFAVRWAAPIPKSASPSTASRGAQDFRMVVIGSNFIPGAKVTFSGSEITADTTFVNSGKLVVYASIDPEAALGPRDVLVRNPSPNDYIGTCKACFTVAVAPQIHAVLPPQKPRNSTNQDLVIVGAGFVPGARVSIVLSGNSTATNGIRVNRSQVVGQGNGVTFSSTVMTVNINIDKAAKLGPRTVIVRNPDGTTASCPACLSITAGPV